jgi:uncharacterized protein
MFRKFSTQLVLVLALAVAGPALAQSPTPHQVYEAAKAGHIDQAQQMLNQVLKDHPESGEAHFIQAELYAREGNLPSARSELATAETLKPGLPFANAASVARLRAELNGNRAVAPQYTTSQVHSAVPWGAILVIVAIIAVLWAVMRRRAATAVYQQGGGPVMGGGGGPGYGPGGPGYGGPAYGPGYAPGSGMGGTIAGGLAGGLAAGAGIVAGEELAHHFLDGNREGSGVVPAPGNEANPNGDMGGNDFGVNDGNSWDDGGGSGGGGDFGGGGGGDDWT